MLKKEAAWPAPFFIFRYKCPKLLSILSVLFFFNLICSPLASPAKPAFIGEWEIWLYNFGNKHIFIAFVHVLGRQIFPSTLCLPHSFHISISVFHDTRCQQWCSALAVSMLLTLPEDLIKFKRTHHSSERCAELFFVHINYEIHSIGSTSLSSL